MPASNKNRTSAAAALLCIALWTSGCVFVPPAETVSERAVPAAAPDPSAARLPPLDTSRFADVDPHAELVGEMQVLFAHYENTFSAIARVHDLGYEALRHANPGVDQWLPGEGTPVYLPTRSILPDAPRDGIVVNLPAMRLYYFETTAPDEEGQAGLVVTSHPIGIGREGWETPTGAAKVTQRARDPAWYVPASVRKEHAELGDPLPAVVPAGPDNPLGRYALLLSLPGYLIHGTNKPSGVGMRVSHGCIRLYPEDIETLYGQVSTGTAVHIVDQPVLAGWADGELYLEVHPALDEEPDLAAEAEKALARAIARRPSRQVSLNREAVARIVEERRGIPFPVGDSARSPSEYLAASRIIDNTVPLPQTAATAD
jgi:L,D-transpeptidase ErfK/SrfK